MKTESTSREAEPIDAGELPFPGIDVNLVGRGRLVIVGLGGIGSFLARLVTLFAASLGDVAIRVVLIDGDSFEERNAARMEVPDLDNKAALVCSLLNCSFGRPRLSIRPVESYLDVDNVEELIRERDIVFSCVDNHATRKLIGERCERLDDVVLISGGNDGVEAGQRGTYGNVQVYVRREGRELNPSITRFHPEIREPEDEVPGPSCADLAATTAPQIVFTNFLAAAVMGAAFHRLLTSEPGAAMWDEACFELFEARVLAHFLTTT